MNAWKETVMRVGTSEEHNCYFEISPDGDGLGLVLVRTATPKSIEWWGAVEFTVSPSQARALGEAMIAIANSVASVK